MSRGSAAMTTAVRRPPCGRCWGAPRLRHLQPHPAEAVTDSTGSKPDPVPALDRAQAAAGSHGHKSGNRPGQKAHVPHRYRSLSPRKELAGPTEAEPRDDSPGAGQGHRQPTAELLGDVSSVGDGDEQITRRPVPAHPNAT